MDCSNIIPEQYTGPGLVDIQLNGYAGVNFNDQETMFSADELHTVRQALNRRGVVAALPTFITDDFEHILERCRLYATLIKQDDELAKTFPKLHIEGPMISPVEGSRGAHPEQFCRTPAEMPEFLDKLLAASGNRIGIITLAPELPGAIDLIQRGVEAGITMAIGHCNASYEDVVAAVEAGAKISTHLGNGSQQMMPRMNNYIQAQLSADELFASFIPDGHHVPFFTLKNFLRAKTTDRSILTTDAIAAAEMPPGRYRLGNSSEVEVLENGFCQIPGQQNLAGSALTLDMGVINVVKYCDVDWETAWGMASTQPAQLVGLDIPEEVTVEISDKGFVNVAD